MSFDLWCSHVAGKDVHLAAPCPIEFRDGVVRVALNRELGTWLAQSVKDFGISESCLANWMRQAENEAGNAPRHRKGRGGRNPPSTSSDPPARPGA